MGKRDVMPLLGRPATPERACREPGTGTPGTRAHVSGLDGWEGHATSGAGMRPERGQRVAAAWAVRGEPYPAVGAALPVARDLTAALTALVHERVKCLLELQEGGLLPALLRRWLVLRVVHGVPFVSHGLPALGSLRSTDICKRHSP